MVGGMAMLAYVASSAVCRPSIRCPRLCLCIWVRSVAGYFCGDGDLSIYLGLPRAVDYRFFYKVTSFSMRDRGRCSGYRYAVCWLAHWMTGLRGVAR